MVVLVELCCSGVVIFFLVITDYFCCCLNIIVSCVDLCVFMSHPSPSSSFPSPSLS